MEKKLIKKYISNIIFTVLITTILTFLWFGPYQSKIRIKKSLMAYNIDYNNTVEYDGFGYVELNKEKITKKLNITNNGTNLNCIIAFDSNNDQNNYVSYIITDSEGNTSDIKSLNLDGYIIENKINTSTSKDYYLTLWSEKNITGNIKLLLNPVSL